MSTVTATGEPAGASPLSFIQRFVGTFTSPTKTFESLRDHPKWVDMFILHLIVATLSFIPLQPIILRDAIEKGNARIDKAEMSEADKATAHDRQAEMMGKILSVPIGMCTSLFATAVIYLIWALILWVSFAFIVGGKLSFVQALSATNHLGLITTVGYLVKLPLIVMKQSMYVATSLALLVPTDPTNVVWATLNAFDIFFIWTLIAMAIGMVPMARVTPGRSRGVAIGLFIVILLFAAGGAALASLGS